MDPLSFMCRLAAAVPGPGFHTVRYGGILSSAAKWRPLVVPENDDQKARAQSLTAVNGQAPARPRSTWRPWKELLKRSFDIDITCFKCGGPMKLKALLISPKSLRRLLRTLDEPTVAPQRAPPRPPPYFTSQPRNHQQHDSAPQPQGVLFDQPA